MAVNVYVYLFPPNLLYLCSYVNFRAFYLGAILVHARHREKTGVLNRSPHCDLDCELGYCCICGIRLLFQGRRRILFLYFWNLDPLEFEECNH